MKILAGDIGGTKTLLQIANAEGDRLEVLYEERFDSHRYGDFLPLAEEFLQHAGHRSGVDKACFGVAGPVMATPAGETVETTNLPWRLDSARLSEALGIPKVGLINDFKAIGNCVEALTAADVRVLQAGRPDARGPRMVLGAGTGLGVAQLLWCGGRYEVFASQGGHVDFAPGDAQQVALLQYLMARHDHVSCEHVLSGPGLVSIYQFILDRAGTPESPELAAKRQTHDPAAAVAEAALAGEDSNARRALAMFADIYAAQAGNLALINLAYGGVYLAGGIAPKVVAFLDSDRFRETFSHKGRMAPLLKDIPLSVITNAKAGLIGALQAARRL